MFSQLGCCRWGITGQITISKQNKGKMCKIFNCSVMNQYSISFFFFKRQCKPVKIGINYVTPKCRSSEYLIEVNSKQYNRELLLLFIKIWMLTHYRLQLHTKNIKAVCAGLLLAPERHQLCQQHLHLPALFIHGTVSFHPSGYLFNELDELLSTLLLHSLEMSSTSGCKWNY